MTLIRLTSCDPAIHNGEALLEQGISLKVVISPSLSEPLPASDVLLMAESTPQSTLDYIKHYQAQNPECKLIIQLHPNSCQAQTYLQAGVSALLDHTPSTDELISIVTRVYHGQHYLDHNLAQTLALRYIKQLLEPFSQLSSREFDVFCLLAEGHSLQTIAQQLDISSKTVSNCQTQVKLKLNLNNRAAIQQYAKSHGLLINKGL